MSKITPEDHIDPEYDRLRKKKSGRKLLRVLRLLCEGIMTKSEITHRTRFSVSEVQKLVNHGLRKEYIKSYTFEGKFRRRPGRRQQYEPADKPGRKPDYFCLSGNGKWLIRFDPEVCDKWEQLGIRQEGIVEHSGFDSYTDFIYAVRKNQTLNRYDEPYYYMDQELERTVLNAFLFPSFLKEEDREALYDELIKVMKQSVAPEHIIGYYRTLETAISELEKILERHRLLLEKMEVLEEVRKYKR